MEAIENNKGALLVEFQYTKQDYIDAQRLHVTPTRRMWLWLVLYFMALVAVFLFTGGYSTSLSGLLWLSAVWALLCLILWFVYVPWSASRTYAKHPLAHLTMHIALRSEGLCCRSPRGENILLWQDFIRWRVNEKTILLYLSPRTFWVIPERLTTSGFPVKELKIALIRELGLPHR